MPTGAPASKTAVSQAAGRGPAFSATAACTSRARTAHQFKGTVREWRDGGLVVPTPAPTGTAATLRAYDARGRKFWERGNLNRRCRRGRLTESVPLPKTTLGRYRSWRAFHLPAKKAPPTQGSIRTTGTTGQTGTMTTTATARRPTACAGSRCRNTSPTLRGDAQKAGRSGRRGPRPPSVCRPAITWAKRSRMPRPSWSLKADDTPFEPAGFDDYEFCSHGRTGLPAAASERGELSLDGQGALSDADGTLLLSPNIVLNAAQPAPRRVALQASVTDQDQQTVSAHTALHRPQLGFLPGAAPVARRGARGRTAAGGGRRGGSTPGRANPFAGRSR